MVCLIPSDSILMLKSKIYRQACIASQKKSSTHSALTAHKWKTYWSFSLTVQSCNIWFQVLHSKISSRSILFQLSPTIFDLDKCVLCFSTVGDIAHFTFGFPNKQFIWKTMGEYTF
ncbi:hypothetical protein BCV72DRAFT_284333 [Rhizopus microsporus var. microsporus]|uniref:Reverse transcriptase zinc-binding domain-containing protein n=1 Tax=Rhizopus microsporus var. microsporus TaxID=86635 RepID=A0A1X0RH37_RHIZD|nr:hypothetical protein BCV72DRAFT_284333 [Rhizopus microsporus var. microsporus]